MNLADTHKKESEGWMQIAAGYEEALSKALDQRAELVNALEFARRRIAYYGTISDRRHFDHDLAEVYPKIDAALNR